MSNTPEVLSLKQITEIYDISYSLLTKATMSRAFPFYRRSAGQNKGQEGKGKIYVKHSDFLNWLLAEKYESKNILESQAAISA